MIVVILFEKSFTFSSPSIRAGCCRKVLGGCFELVDIVFVFVDRLIGILRSLYIPRVDPL